MGTHLSTAISCQASPHFRLNSAHKAPERERNKGGGEDERKKRGKREKMFESALSMFKGKPASWAEIVNVKHLLQLMFNP